MTSTRFKSSKIVISGLLATAVAAPVWADLHKCVDKQNRTYYQDKPCQEMSSAKLSGSLSRMGAKEEAKAFFWKATDQKGTLYLLGSMHFGGQSPFTLPQMVNDAFKASDVLVVEADIETLSEKELANGLQGKGRYADNTKLEDHVKPITWKKTLELGNQLGINEEALLPLKPWLAALILTTKSLNKQGYTVETGVDKSLIAQAQGKKPVVELENTEAEIDLIDRFSDQEQEQMLLHALQKLSRGGENQKNGIDAWKDGDAEAMELVVRQSFDSGQLGSKLYKVFLPDRNERMANRLADLAKDGRTYFIIVGADHFGGQSGILKSLEDKGYDIAQP